MAVKCLPLARGTFSWGDGYRIPTRPTHQGQDFPANLGTPIYAPVDALVIQGKDRAPGSVSGFSNWVWLDAQSNWGVDLIFGHMKHSEIFVTAGQTVKAGQLIARVGNEGDSYGAHLHFEVWGPPGRSGGTSIDPKIWLNGATDPLTSAPLPEGTTMQLVDYAAARIGADAVKAAGYAGAIRYLANSPDRGLPNKILTAEEAARYRELGMPIVSNWQKGKGATADWRRGYAGGAADAQAALDHHFAVGGSGWSPIFFSIDDDVTLDQWNSLCAPYLKGAASVIGKQWVGMYGGSKQCAWAIEDDVIGHSTTVGKRWLWQTRAWSNGQRESAAVLYQARIDQDSIGGVGIDVNDVLAPDFGQWQIDRSGMDTPEPPKPGGSLPAMTDPITRVQITPNKHSGGRNVTWLCFHTQQARSSAANLANYCCNPAPGGNPNAAVSYNAVGDEHETILLVPYDQNPWAASNANTRADHYCFAGSFAEWSTDQWLDPGLDGDGINQDLMMNRGALWLAERAQARGIPLEYVGKAGVDAGRPGVVGHVDFGAWGGGHTDPGPYFPWAELIRRAIAITNHGGFLMALSEDEQRELLEKVRDVHFENKYRFNSRVEGSTYTDTAVGYALNTDASAYRTEQQVQRLIDLAIEQKQEIAALAEALYGKDAK